MMKIFNIVLTVLMFSVLAVFVAQANSCQEYIDKNYPY